MKTQIKFNVPGFLESLNIGTVLLITSVMTIGIVYAVFRIFYPEFFINEQSKGYEILFGLSFILQLPTITYSVNKLKDTYRDDKMGLKTLLTNLTLSFVASYLIILIANGEVSGGLYIGTYVLGMVFYLITLLIDTINEYG